MVAGKSDDDIHMLGWTFLLYEAGFLLTGYVKSRSNCLWYMENPHVVHETLLHTAEIVM
jgi:hypothetical protein